MRVIQNLTISWETNFYDKNTCQGKVITKKNDLAQNNSSGPFYRAIKSKVTFRPIFRQRVAIPKIFLQYIPCPMISLSSRKSWEIFALPIEKIDF